LTAQPELEKAIREHLKETRGVMPTGELTKADLEKVTELNFFGNQLTEVPKGLEKLTNLTYLSLRTNKLTDVTGLEKLPQLKTLYLINNHDLTKAQIEELQKALPKCHIESNPKK
jgi:Leucine-rich repeat (LRR) protein